MDYIEATFCIDHDSVAAVGFSGGAALTLNLGTDERVAGRFKTLVTVAGVPFRGFNNIPYVHHGTRMLGIYGRNDTVMTAFPNVPGRPEEALANTGWYFSTWQNTPELWARYLGCSRDMQAVQDFIDQA